MVPCGQIGAVGTGAVFPVAQWAKTSRVERKPRLVRDDDDASNIFVQNEIDVPAFRLADSQIIFEC